jgi:hypothetical protein
MRWGVPVAAAAVVAAAVGAGPVIAAVQGDPALPERTAEQLLADLIEQGRSDRLPPFSGTVVETASLGLPELPALGGGGESSSPSSLLAGTNQIKVWYGGPERIRLALPGRMSETDLIRNGDQWWLWQSEENTATRIRMNLDRAHAGQGRHGEGAPGTPAPATLTPPELARQILERVDDDTTVRVTDTERVAGRPVYQLVVAPKDEASLVREVRLAVDGETLVPLRVQIYADGAVEPALEVGFTEVTFTPPAPEMFDFTPPAGAKVTEADPEPPRGHGELPEAAREARERAHREVRTIGEGWTRIVSVPMTEQELLGGLRRESGPEARQAQELVRNVLDSARPVSGAWGRGRVIETKLVSVLITDDGRVLAGAVTPEALVEAAGKN